MNVSVRAILRAVACGLIFVGAAAAARAPSELTLLATDPAPDALMARQQPFFVRFEVKAGVPVTVGVSGWFKGKPVLDNGGSGVPVRLSTSGVGVVSFFYWGEQPTRIDEVRLHVTDAATGAKVNDYGFPVALTWLADDPAPREPAAWVKAWQKNPRATPIADAGTPANSILWAGALAALAILAAIVWFIRKRRAHAGDAQRPQ
jgi:hypothetical protein